MITSSTDVQFSRSSFCSGGACIEVGFSDTGAVLVRDGKRPSAAHQVFTPRAWSAFLTAVRAKEFGRIEEAPGTVH